MNLEISSKRSYMKRLIMKSIILYKNLASCLKLIYTKNINPINKEKKMAEVEWTNDQLNAITKKDSNILVAAAARKWKNSCISRANYKKNNRR